MLEGVYAKDVLEFLPPVSFFKYEHLSIKLHIFMNTLKRTIGVVLVGILTITTLFAVLTSTVPAIAETCDTTAAETKATAALNWHKDNGSNALMFWKIMNALDPDHTIANPAGSDPTNSGGDTIELDKLETFIDGKAWNGWNVIMPAVRCVLKPPAEVVPADSGQADDQQVDDQQADEPEEEKQRPFKSIHPNCAGDDYDFAIQVVKSNFFGAVGRQKLSWRIMWTLGFEDPNYQRPDGVEEELITSEEVQESPSLHLIHKKAIVPVIQCTENVGKPVTVLPLFLRVDKAKTIANRGDWNSNTHYDKGDIVRPLNSWIDRYIALSPSKGEAPSATSTSWEKIARSSPMRQNVKVFEVFATRKGIEQHTRDITITTEGTATVSPATYTETFGRTNKRCNGTYSDPSCQAVYSRAGTLLRAAAPANTLSQEIKVTCTKGEEDFVTVSDDIGGSERFQVCWE